MEFKLDEARLARLNEAEKRLFIYEWLCLVQKNLHSADKMTIKSQQKPLVDQLLSLLSSSSGPPIRQLIGGCLATLFAKGDTFLLFECVNKCNDLLKHEAKGSRLSAITALGCMYERLGRMMGRSYEETVQILLKLHKSGDLQTRLEIMTCLYKILFGVGNAATQYHRDISKSMKACLAERTLAIRETASSTLSQIPSLELDVLLTLSIRALEGADYRTRLAVSHLLATVFSNAVKAKQKTLEECLQLLSTAFIRGNLGGLFKGTEGVKAGIRETRAGIAHAYVYFLDKMGGLFVERHFKHIVTHLIETVANPKTAQSHLDGVFSRSCVLFILRSVFCSLLSDKAQRSACRELGHILLKQLNQKSGPNSLICIFEVVSMIVVNLESTVNSVVQDSSVGLVEITFSALTNSNATVRIYAAYLLRWITQAQPALLSPIMQRCIDQFEVMKSSAPCISGYSCAIAAMLSSSDVTLSQLTNLRKYKLMFSISEEMLRSAKDDPSIALLRAQKGWLIMGSIMGLGPSTVRSLLPRLLLLWKSSFPRTHKDFAMEKSRGDSMTWECVLENRAGALAAMSGFLSHCREIANEDIQRRLLSPIESALFMVSNLADVIKQYGQQLKAAAAMVRFRLYQVLLQIPAVMYEASYNMLLKLLVTDITLADHSQSTTTTSRLHIKYMTNKFYVKEEHKMIEEALYADGALEHDLTDLYRKCDHNLRTKPLPLGVSLIDAAVDLFGYVFPHVQDKHRQQVVVHFTDCIRHNSKRADSIYTNVLSSLFVSIKSLVKSQANLSNIDVARSVVDFSLAALSSHSELVRHAAAEVIGYTAVAASSRQLVNDTWSKVMDVLDTVNDPIVKSGHTLALGYLHRYTAGYMSDSQHFAASLKILLSMAQDNTSPLSQSGALFGLNSLAYSGSSFRPHVDVALSVVLQTMLSAPRANIEVHQNLGRCLQTFIGTLGPELQVLPSSTRNLRIGCRMLQNHSDPVVKSGALGALQQLQLFAPKDINIAPILSFLCSSLESEHVTLRHAAIACLRQFLQRDPMEIFYHIAENPPLQDANVIGQVDDDARGLPWERGLILVIFSVMDVETEKRALSQLKDILISLLSLSCLSDWLSICKQVLADTSTDGDEEDKLLAGNDDGESEDAEQQFQHTQEPETHPWVGPRWRTKAFALECVIRLVQLCDEDRTHFDVVMARQAQTASVGQKQKSFLILHLSELIRMAFMACTSDSVQLTVSGLKLLQMIIDRFADVPEPEFEGHMILEQFQAQVDAALRPAFSAGDTPSEVIALACHVCSTWICSAVSDNLLAVQRVHTLLANSLHKVMAQPSAKGEISSLEIISVLKAWAEVYIRGITINPNLLTLIEADIHHLSQYWLAFMKDYAMLGLPSSLASQLPHDGGAFFTHEVAEHCKLYYKDSWPPVLHAVTLWLCKENGFDIVRDCTEEGNAQLPQSFSLPKSHEATGKRWFCLLYAICSEALYNRSEHTMFALSSLDLLVSHEYSDLYIERDSFVELISILHRTLITESQTVCRDVVLDIAHKVALKLNRNPNEDNSSPAYSLLNLSLCTAVIHCPSLSEKLARVVPKLDPGSSSDVSDLENAVALANLVPSLLNPELAIEVLPSILHINLRLLLEGCAGSKVLQSLRFLCSMSRFEENDDADGGLQERYVKVLTAALHSLLVSCSDDAIFTHSSKGASSILLAVAIFICTAPSSVTNVASIHEKILDLYERALDSDNPIVVKTGVSCVRNIFGHTRRNVFIQRWSEKVYGILLESQDANICMECISCLQTLLEITPEEHRLPVLKIIVTMLLSLAMKKTLSDQIVIEILTNKLSQHSGDLKKILAESPALKIQLEKIIKSRQMLAQARNNAPEPVITSKQPTIQLKSDFRNFIK
ncbi:HEAT repeat-containing protein 5B [Galendromus occidentalis]|uniref:HEAT repeat-containing protein 5B n=1 Tax=Galendromus occidentalis TaxID=34638 RepID=A0AAJ7SF50_9ACAR|nr:HEAT repeat-containing protein 5B [Galendromus occidentalis]